MTPSFDLTGRLAVVTGCRRGIGFAMAEALASAGADIIGVSANLEPAGSTIERRVQSVGRTFTACRVDLSNQTAVARGLAPEGGTGTSVAPSSRLR